MLPLATVRFERFREWVRVREYFEKGLREMVMKLIENR